MTASLETTIDTEEFLNSRRKPAASDGKVRRPAVGQRWIRREDPQIAGTLTVVDPVGHKWVWEADAPFQPTYKGRLEPPRKTMVFIARHDLYRKLRISDEPKEKKTRHRK